MSPLLDGTRVVEVGGRGAGVCTRLFAELGADVVAVHAPGAHIGFDLERGAAIVLHKNKRHRSLDLSSADGRASFDHLAA